MRKTKALAAAVAALGASALSAPVSAEFYGMVNGRSADLSRLPDMSIEGGATIGELLELDYQHFGVRFNYRVDPAIMVYGDFGQTELDAGGGAEDDGTSLGAGAYYQLDGVVESTDLAIKGSYHRIGVEAAADDDRTFSVIVIEALFSGREPIGANDNINWYANVGMHRIDFDDVFDDETEFGFGGGVIIPNASNQGEFYVGLDLIDEIVFGGGYRYFLK